MLPMRFKWSKQQNDIILETGIGQSDTKLWTILMFHYMYDTWIWCSNTIRKIDMLDFADLVALNKFDKRGALDAFAC
jgi:methylmalonyl-CoA mutase